jgi:hypothetical protein
MTFKPNEVLGLYKYQTRGGMHPFTCPNHNDDNHRPEMDFLLPTVRGWICPFCDYTQDWAHNWMKES